MDTNETLLKFKGDASGAVAAAQQQAAAVKQAAAEVNELTAAENAAASGGGVQAQHNMGAAAEDVAAKIRAEADELYGIGDAGEDAGKRIGAGADKAKAGFNNFAEILSAIDPRLGMLVRSGGKLEEAFTWLMSPGGLAVAGLTAAGAVMVGLMNTALNKMEEIKRKAEEVRQQAERLNAVRLDKEASIAQHLARAGVGDAGTRQAATGMAAQLTGFGFDESAAQAVAAAVAAGEVEGLTNGDMRRLALAQQMGDVDVSGGRSGVEAFEKVRSALAKLQSGRQEQEGGVQAIIGTRKDELTGIVDRGVGIDEELAARTGASGERLAELAKGVRNALLQRRGGDIGNAEVSESAKYWAEQLVKDAEGITANEKRQQERMVEVAGGRMPATQVRSIYEFDAEERYQNRERQRRMDDEFADAEERRRNRPKAQAERMPFDPNLANQPVQVINFHGVNNVGTRDPRMLRGPRVKAM